MKIRSNLYPLDNISDFRKIRNIVLDGKIEKIKMKTEKKVQKETKSSFVSKTPIPEKKSTYVKLKMGSKPLKTRMQEFQAQNLVTTGDYNQNVKTQLQKSFCSERNKQKMRSQEVSLEQESNKQLKIKWGHNKKQKISQKRKIPDTIAVETDVENIYKKIKNNETVSSQELILALESLIS